MNPKKVHESKNHNQINLKTPKDYLTDETLANLSINCLGLFNRLFKIRTNGFK